MALDPDTEANINDLQLWFQENDNLPEEIDRTLLRRFYRSMYGDMDGTKNLIEINYALRYKYPHIFLNRDPRDNDSCATFAYADMIPLPGLTPERYKVCCYRLCDNDPSKMHHTEDTKAFFMVSDCRFCLPDENDGSLSDGEVQIFDMTGYTMRHVSKLTFNTLRIYMKFLQEALPVRLKAIHIINCPSYLDKIVSVIKPFVSKDVYKLIHFHITGIETLYEHVPRDMLPDEYGGRAGSMKELKANIMTILDNKRDYLMDPKQWKIEKIPSEKASWSLF